jgi:O-antigen/teichoic acid export membrane protein
MLISVDKDKVEKSKGIPRPLIKVANNSLWNIGGLMAGALINLVSTPILIYLLGKDQFGLMALLISILTPLGLLDFGIGEATVKYMAEYLGRDDRVQAGKYLRSTFLFNLCVGCLGGIVIVASARFLITWVFNVPSGSRDLARHCLYWIGLNWCVMQIRQTFTGVVMAVQEYGLLNIGNIITNLMTIGVGLGALVWGGDLLDLVRIQAIVAALMALGWLIVAERLLPNISFFPRLDLFSFRKTLGFGLWQMLNRMGGILGHQSERWLLGVLLPVYTVGFYNVGVQVVTVIYLAAYKTGEVLFPAVSEMQGQLREEEAARLVIQANWVITALAISCFVPLIVFAPDLLFVWIGLDFALNTANLLRILAFGSAASCLFAIPSFYLLGVGKSKWLALMSFIQGIITFGVAALLIPRVGLAGAGWGMSLSTTVHVTVLILIWKRIFRIWIPARVYFSATFGQYGVGAAIAIGLMLLRDTFTWSLSWVSLGVLGFLCALISVILIFFVDNFLPGGTERRKLIFGLGADRVPMLSRLLVGR